MSLLDPSIGWIEIGTESTYGTEAGTLTPVLLTEPLSISESIQQVTRQVVKHTEGPLAHQTLDDRLSVSGTVEVAPNQFDDSDQTPSVGPLLVAGGCAEATSGATSSNDVAATYTPQTSGKGSASIIWHYIDRDSGQYVQIKALGYVGTFTFNFAIGEHVTLDFEGEALYAEASAPASITEPTTYNKGETPLTTAAGSFAFGSVNANISQYSFAANQETHAVEKLHADPKVSELFVKQGDRPGGSVDPLVTDSGFQASGTLDVARKATAQQMDFSVTEDSAKELNLSMPNAQIGMPDMATADEYLRFDTPYFANESAAGDGDEFSIEFKRTAA